MTPSTTPDVERIRCLNDRLRSHFIGGQAMITQGVQALGPEFRVAAVLAVRAFDTFTEENDPHGEHDFGSVEIAGTTVVWKIDYYDRMLEGASPDPADPAQTMRVLTVLLADEY